MALTDKVLEINNQDQFTFDALDTRTEEEKAVKRVKESNARKKESMKLMEELEKENTQT